MEACDKIMAYGFIVILLLCSGFLWFIKVKLVLTTGRPKKRSLRQVPGVARGFKKIKLE